MTREVVGPSPQRRMVQFHADKAPLLIDVSRIESVEEGWQDAVAVWCGVRWQNGSTVLYRGDDGQLRQRPVDESLDEVRRIINKAWSDMPPIGGSGPP